MFETRNDLPESTRTKSVELLGPALACAIDLQLQAKHAHWNVKGANFIALHKLFDDVAESVEKYVDVLAERITALGGVAEGTIQSVSRASILRPYPMAIADGKDHIEALAGALATFGGEVRQGIDAAEELGDKDTGDVFLQISRGIDQQLWFVEAHVQRARALERMPRRRTG